LSGQGVHVVFAEMPEAEGRDLSIERQELPPDARIATYTHRGDPAALAAACRGADAILTDYVPFDRTILGRLEGCRIISVAATGWDCVDATAAAERGIAVAAVGEYCTEEVADHALALLLALERRLREYDRQVQVDHSWRWNDVQGIERLAGRTLGLVGFGRIGQAVCRRALGFGLAVLACDPRVDEVTIRRHGAEPASFEDLLARADILSLHSNLDAGSRRLLDQAAFAKMRRRPALINVARGGLVVEADLVAALDAGLVRGAALDVLAEDSPDLGHHPLVGRRDVLLTPHVAFYSESALQDLRRISAANIRAFLDGRPGDVFRLVTPAAGAT
jgi:D-3-phosphoglycerate dehydrogenase